MEGTLKPTWIHPLAWAGLLALEQGAQSSLQPGWDPGRDGGRTLLPGESSSAPGSVPAPGLPELCWPLRLLQGVGQLSPARRVRAGLVAKLGPRDVAPGTSSTRTRPDPPELSCCQKHTGQDTGCTWTHTGA